MTDANPNNNEPRPLTREEFELLQTEQEQATSAYARALLLELQQQGGQLDLVSAYVQLRIGQVHFQSLLNQIALQTGFDMGALHREFCERLHTEAQNIAAPQVQIAVASAVRRKQ